MGSFSIWHWLIVLLVVVLIFGTKKLRNLGTDLGGAVKGFKDGMKTEEDKNKPEIPPPPARRSKGRRGRKRPRREVNVTSATANRHGYCCTRSTAYPFTHASPFTHSCSTSVSPRCW